MEGVVKFFNEEKGFGFISDNESDKEYFVHITNINEGTKITKEDLVSFDLEESDRGPKAVNVSKIEGKSEAKEASEESAKAEEEWE